MLKNNLASLNPELNHISIFSLILSYLTIFTTLV